MRIRVTLALIPGLLPSVVLALLAGAAHGQIFVNYGNGIGVFSACGVPVNTNFISGLDTPQGIAVSGTNIFVANYGAGTIGKYTTSGETINASLITGLNWPEGIAVDGTNLFVANYLGGTILKYTTSGTRVLGFGIGGLSYPVGVAISGTNLFVANTGPSPAIGL